MLIIILQVKIFDCPIKRLPSLFGRRNIEKLHVVLVRKEKPPKSRKSKSQVVKPDAPAAIKSWSVYNDESFFPSQVLFYCFNGYFKF